MSQKSNDTTFSVRAALFASPVGSSSAVPKKKVAREVPRAGPPVFALEHDVSEVTDRNKDGTFLAADACASGPTLKVPDETQGCPETFSVSEHEDDDDVEPMEVDGTIVPSPQRATPTRGVTPCEKSTTPRRRSSRKSMPTPGKRLFFTSKDTTNEDRKADDSTQLELLMAKIPQEMSGYMKKLATDIKEMSQYDAQLARNIDDMEAVFKSRETKLKSAIEIAKDSFISSALPLRLETLDMTLRKEESPNDIVARLHGSFLDKTQDAGNVNTAQKENQQLEDERGMLEEKLESLNKIKREKDEFLAKMRKEEEEALARREEIKQGFERIDALMSKIKPIPIFEF